MGFTMLLENELVVDNFAGGGGASDGIQRAIKRSVDIAINHDASSIHIPRSIGLNCTPPYPI